MSNGQTPDFIPDTSAQQAAPDFIPATPRPSRQQVPPAARPAAPQPRVNVPNAASMTAWHPSFWQRLGQATSNIPQQIGAGGLFRSGGASNLSALQKPTPGMQDPRALAPERLMTPEEQKRHPMATAVGEFAGGFTTPGAMLTQAVTGGLGKILPGVAGFIIPRLVSGGFSAQQLYDAYQQYPQFREAMDRGDASEAERLFTHMTLGTASALMGLHHAVAGEGVPTAGRGVREAAKGVTERRANVQRVGQQALLAEGLSRDLRTVNMLDTFGLAIHNKVSHYINMLQDAYKNDALASMRPVIEADRNNPKPVVTETAAREAQEAIQKTGYKPNKEEQAVIDKLGAGTAEQRVLKELNLTPEQARSSPNWKGIEQMIAAEKGKPGGSGLTLEEAIHLRTAARRAGRWARGTPEGNKVDTITYGGLTAAIGERVNEIQGLPEGTKQNAWNDYNQNFTAMFQNESKDSYTSNFLSQPLDENVARDPVKGFGTENISSTLRQMRNKGIDSHAFEMLQQDARRISNARAAAANRVSGGLFSMLRSPRKNWPAITAYVGTKALGGTGLVPYLAAAVAMAGSGERTSISQLGEALRRHGLPEDVVKAAVGARVEPGPFREPQIVQGPAPKPPEAPTPKAKPAPPPPSYKTGSLLGDIEASYAEQAAKRRAAKPKMTAEELRRRTAEAARPQREARTAAQEEEMRARQRKEMELLGKRQRFTPRQLERRAQEEE